MSNDSVGGYAGHLGQGGRRHLAVKLTAAICGTSRFRKKHVSVKRAKHHKQLARI